MCYLHVFDQALHLLILLLLENYYERGKLVPLALITLISIPGNPRNKVALSPGHSLMDWIRLGNSGADLTGVGGKLQRVTEDELAKHHLPDNAWLVIRGQYRASNQWPVFFFYK